MQASANFWALKHFTILSADWSEMNASETAISLHRASVCDRKKLKANLESLFTKGTLGFAKESHMVKTGGLA